ncbi:MAG: VTT domain-containing protein [Pseudomonadota bacterium]
MAVSENMDAGQPEKKSPILVRLWPLYLIAGGLALVFSQGWHNYLSLEALRANIDTLDGLVRDQFLLIWGAYIAIYAFATMFMVPGGILTIAGGALFGLIFGLPLYGTTATVIGASIGASVLFIAARSSLGGVLRDIAGPFLSKMEAEFNDSPFSYMFVLRLVPAVPFAVANIAPGLLGAKYRDYIITTFFGIIPGTLAYSWVGAGAAELIRDKSVSLDDTQALIGALVSKVSPALIALFAVALIPLVYKKFFKKSGSAQ